MEDKRKRERTPKDKGRPLPSTTNSTAPKKGSSKKLKPAWGQDLNSDDDDFENGILFPQSPLKKRKYKFPNNKNYHDAHILSKANKLQAHIEKDVPKRKKRKLEFDEKQEIPPKNVITTSKKSNSSPIKNKIDDFFKKTTKSKSLPDDKTVLGDSYMSKEDENELSDSSTESEDAFDIKNEEKETLNNNVILENVSMDKIKETNMSEVMLIAENSFINKEENNLNDDDIKPKNLSITENNLNDNDIKPKNLSITEKHEGNTKEEIIVIDDDDSNGEKETLNDNVILENVSVDKTKETKTSEVMLIAENSFMSKEENNLNDNVIKPKSLSITEKHEGNTKEEIIVIDDDDSNEESPNNLFNLQISPTHNQPLKIEEPQCPTKKETLRETLGEFRLPDPQDNKHGASECQICFCPVQLHKHNRITEHCICKRCAETLKTEPAGSEDVLYYCLECRKLVPAQIYDEDSECRSDDCHNNDDNEDFEFDTTIISRWNILSRNLKAREQKISEETKKIETHLDRVKKELTDMFSRISYNVSTAINERQEATELEFRQAVCEDKKLNSIKKRKELLECVRQKVAKIISLLEAIKLLKDKETIDIYMASVESQSMAVVDGLVAIENDYADNNSGDEDDQYSESDEEDSEHNWKDISGIRIPSLTTEDAKSYNSHGEVKKDLEEIKVLFEVEHIVKIINELYKYQL